MIRFPFSPPAVLARSLSSLLFVGMLLLCSGCAPKDPFARKVRASTPEALNHWWAKTQTKLPPALAEELQSGFDFLDRNTPTLKARTGNDHYDPMCKQLDGLTIREALILMYDEQNNALFTRLSRNSTHLENLVNGTGSDSSEAYAAYREKIIASTQQQTEKLSETIARNRARIAELEAKPKT